MIDCMQMFAVVLAGIYLIFLASIWTCPLSHCVLTFTCIIFFIMPGYGYHELMVPNTWSAYVLALVHLTSMEID